jgi:RING finger/CHY zinc finger protein 1
MACPLCKKSVHSEDQRAYIIQYMDLEVQRTPMPEEYRQKRVKVVCNDCEQESVTPFHIVGLKCCGESCGSYNTVKIGEAPDALDDSTLPAPEQPNHS